MPSKHVRRGAIPRGSATSSSSSGQDARLSLAQHGFNSRTRRHASPGGSGTDATNAGKAVRFRRGAQRPLPADRAASLRSSLVEVRLLAGAPQGATNGRSTGSYPVAQANPVQFRTLLRRRRSERARFHTALARAFDSHRRHLFSSLVQSAWTLAFEAMRSWFESTAGNQSERGTMAVHLLREQDNAGSIPAARPARRESSK